MRIEVAKVDGTVHVDREPARGTTPPTAVSGSAVRMKSSGTRFSLGGADRFEAEADRNALRILQGNSSSLGATRAAGPSPVRRSQSPFVAPPAPMSPPRAASSPAPVRASMSVPRALSGASFGGGSASAAPIGIASRVERAVDNHTTRVRAKLEAGGGIVRRSVDPTAIVSGFGAGSTTSQALSLQVKGQGTTTIKRLVVTHAGTVSMPTVPPSTTTTPEMALAGSGVRPKLSRFVLGGADRFEAEAEHNASRIMDGGIIGSLGATRDPGASIIRRTELGHVVRAAGKAPRHKSKVRTVKGTHGTPGHGKDYQHDHVDAKKVIVDDGIARRRAQEVVKQGKAAVLAELKKTQDELVATSIEQRHWEDPFWAVTGHLSGKSAAYNEFVNGAPEASDAAMTPVYEAAWSHPEPSTAFQDVINGMEKLFQEVAPSATGQRDGKKFIGRRDNLLRRVWVKHLNPRLRKIRQLSNYFICLIEEADAYDKRIIHATPYAQYRAKTRLGDPQDKHLAKREEARKRLLRTPFAKLFSLPSYLNYNATAAARASAGEMPHLGLQSLDQTKLLGNPRAANFWVVKEDVRRIGNSEDLIRRVAIDQWSYWNKVANRAHIMVGVGFKLKQNSTFDELNWMVPTRERMIEHGAMPPDAHQGWASHLWRGHYHDVDQSGLTGGGAREYIGKAVDLSQHVAPGSLDVWTVFPQGLKQHRPRLKSSGLVLGQAGDRFEREAERNEFRISNSGGGGRLGLTASRGASGDAARGKNADGGISQEFESLVSRSSGSSLNPGVRSRMEGMFGASFAGVRIHTDAAATQASRSIRAEAFTIGRDVYFAPGRFQPGTTSGMALLGHELTHVLQGGGGTKLVRRREPGMGVCTPQDPTGVGTTQLLAMSDERFIATVRQWDVPTFSARIYNGEQVRHEGLWKKFKRALVFIGDLGAAAGRWLDKGWWLAVEMGESLGLHDEHGELAKFTEHRHHDIHHAHSLEFAAHQAHHASHLIKEVGEIAELRRLPTGQLMALSDMEFWHAVKHWDARTFKARVFDGVGVKDEQLFSRFKKIINKRKWKGVTELVKDLENGESVGAALVKNKSWARGIAKRVGETVEHLKQPEGFIAKLLDKIAGPAERIITKLEGMKSAVILGLKEIGIASKWIHMFTEGGEIGIFGKVLPMFREALYALRNCNTLSTVGTFIGNIFSKFGSLLFSFGKKILEFLPFAALGADLVEMMKGPKALLPDIEDPAAKRKVEEGHPDAKGLHQLYWAPVLFLDTASLLSTFIPPIKPIGLIADAVNIAWSGFWKRRWGVGIRIAEAVFRKGQGSSQFEDGDPELDLRAEKTKAIYGDEPGVSLDISTKYRLERMLGVDLGEVRLHTGPLARALGESTEAEALTIGRNIYMPDGAFDTASPQGLGLLAHEALHVAQERPASPTLSPVAIGKGSAASMEAAARAVEARVASGIPGAAVSVAKQAATATAPEMVLRAEAEPAATAAVEAPAAAVAVEAARPAVQRRAHAPTEATRTADPVQQVMGRVGIADKMSQEEFTDFVTDRILDLMRDEIQLDVERGHTKSWTDWVGGV